MIYCIYCDAFKTDKDGQVWIGGDKNCLHFGIPEQIEFLHKQINEIQEALCKYCNVCDCINECKKNYKLYIDKDNFDLVAVSQKEINLPDTIVLDMDYFANPEELWKKIFEQL